MEVRERIIPQPIPIGQFHPRNVNPASLSGLVWLYEMPDPKSCARASIHIC